MVSPRSSFLMSPRYFYEVTFLFILILISIPRISFKKNRYNFYFLLLILFSNFYLLFVAYENRKVYYRNNHLLAKIYSDNILRSKPSLLPIPFLDKNLPHGICCFSGTILISNYLNLFNLKTIEPPNGCYYDLNIQGKFFYVCNR
jgi:hypothetical protein